MKRVRVVLSSFLLLLSASALTDCSGKRGSTAGNPSLISIEIGGYTSATLSSLSICPGTVRVKAADGQTVTTTLNPNELALSQNTTPLATLALPQQAYNQVELDLTTDCASAKSVQLTNANGSFGSADLVTLKFAGDFTTSGETGSVKLLIQPIVNQLNSVNDNSQVQTYAEAASGHLLATGAPVFRQLQEISVNDNSSTVATPAFSAPVSTGNFMLCIVYFNSSVRTVSTVTDSGGNVYWRHNGPTGGSGGSLVGWTMETWYSIDALTGGPGLSVTANFTGAFNGEKNLICHEYSGVDTTDPIDLVSSSSGNSSNLTTAQFSNAVANSLIFGAAAFEVSASPGTGFTQRSSLQNLVTEDQAVNSLGSYGISFLNPVSNWIEHLIIVKGY